jgi:CheY-like chemotaxis protein
MKKVKRILVIDDENVSTFLSQWILEQMAIAQEVVHLPNGREALNMLTLESSLGQPLPDLILLDLEMPVMDGLEFLRELPGVDHLNRLLPRIVVTTGSVNPVHRKAVESLGVRWYISRPLSEEKLRPVFSSMERQAS